MAHSIEPLRDALARRYDIREEIGHGAFAAVYRARDLRHDREVAIKVLDVDPSSDVGELRFLREIRVLAGLQHPNILPLHDSGFVGALLYYVTPYLGGESLRGKMTRERQLAVSDAVRIAREVADGLHSAHKHGVIHRDIKPDNILLSEGHAVVADFGIARIIALDPGHAARLTRTGMGGPGTPAYMSPEQLLGEGDTDARTDIYALGSVLHEMLAGKPPYSGKDGFTRRFTEPPPSIATLRGNVPPQVDQIVHRALQRRPDDRFVDARQMCEALDDVLHGRPSPHITTISPEGRDRIKAPVAGPDNIGLVQPSPPSSAVQDVPTARFRPTVASRQRRYGIFLGVVATVGLVVAGTISMVSAPQWTAATTLLTGRGPELSRRRIVVATFDNRTGNEALDPVGELAADWVARDLLEANFDVVDARARAGGSRGAKGALPTVRQRADRLTALAQETGAASVVTGRYYTQGDSLHFEAGIVDVAKGTLVRAVAPVKGPAASATALIGALALRVTMALAISTDVTPGASTAALVEPPSIEAYEHASRAWGMFFSRPADTAATFAELALASALDTGYTAPLLMKAYVLDVQAQWPALAAQVEAIKPRRERLSRAERSALSLFEADLRGDLLGRLRAATELRSQSPASPDMALLFALSASYLYRFDEALAVFEKSDPDRGINLVSPWYWNWRSAVNHMLGRTAAELHAAEEGARRFPSSPDVILAVARAHAGAGRMRRVEQMLARVGLGTPDPSPDARELALFIARELRAHGHISEAQKLFAQVAALPIGGSSRGAMHRHALALYEADQLDRARPIYEGLLRDDSLDLEATGRLGVIAVRQGDGPAALRIDARLAAWHRPYTFGEPSKLRAQMAAVAGRRSDAVALLRTAVSEGYRPFEVHVISVHEEGDFLSLRSDPGFQAFTQTAGRAVALP
ncbi:MAG: hypothetical protein NVS4B3_06990 [Gemmatimonadaceae bacterium]